ncbi:hypothetical protein H0G86_001698 [Trichoderma simmonsii]|uniref:Uncharacterized protein n=1 Tax=Trichoderma simmonsii TaxID=1491479 RepID=A0A8G0L4B8_9HYPO|nr:hypothetical protein H0G86_001698 [Trichoderma simmonsii]
MQKTLSLPNYNSHQVRIAPFLSFDPHQTAAIMYLSQVFSCILAASGVVAAAEYASLHSGRDLSGARLGVWSLNECLRLPDNGYGQIASGQTHGSFPVVCTLYSDANCTAPHIELFTNTNSPKNFASSMSRSVYCKYR